MTNRSPRTHQTCRVVLATSMLRAFHRERIRELFNAKLVKDQSVSCPAPICKQSYKAPKCNQTLRFNSPPSQATEKPPLLTDRVDQALGFGAQRVASQQTRLYSQEELN